jgi:hypothetical protein
MNFKKILNNEEHDFASNEYCIRYLNIQTWLIDFEAEITLAVKVLVLYSKLL